MRYREIIIEQQFSPAFMAWFRNSKVVDAHGNPLVVYHGTHSDFDIFDTFNGNDLGSHFGNPSQASWVRGDGARVLPVYLSIQNPLRTEDCGRWNYAHIRKTLAEIGIKIEQVPYEAETASFVENSARWERKQRMAITAAIEAAGYDGIVYRNEHEGDGDSWIAFHPSQIKSAIGNSGRFDQNNPSIGESNLSERD